MQSKGGFTGFMSKNFWAQVSNTESEPRILIALYSFKFEEKFWNIIFEFVVVHIQ